MNVCRLSWTVASLAFVTVGCSPMYYSAMEAFGVAKRELLVGRVQDAQESQGEAKEQFQTTFEAFKSLTGFEGGELAARYDALKSEYDRSKRAADDVTRRINSIENVATAMFDEWGTEIAEISNADMRRQSEQMRADTQRKYDQLVQSMRSAEQRMQPVLTAFNDQVLFLKHNLNAAAINSLEGEVVKIESNVEQLIADMQRSIDEADEFLKALPEA